MANILSIKRVLFVMLYLFVAVFAQKKDSDEARKLKAESADRHIRFVSPAEFSVHINDGLWIIMYGANWCKYTQKLTPKWLGLQSRIRSEGLAREINVAKVECTKYMDFCTSQGIDGFPTIYVYENGNKIEEYLGNHEINEMFTFVQEQIARHKSEEIVEEIVTVYVDESVYEEENKENKPRKSSKEEAEMYAQEQQQQQQQQQEPLKPKPKARQNKPNNNQRQPNKKNTKNPPRKGTKNPPNVKKDAKNPPSNRASKQQPRQQNQRKPNPPKNAGRNSNNVYQKGQRMPTKQTYNKPFPPKRPNVVVKATKKVFGLMESIILLVVVLIVIYAVVRFRAIKNHSSYSKSKIPLYRDLTQDEKFMLHYS